MREGTRPPIDAVQRGEPKEANFDKEQEKERRKEIRKELEDALTEVFLAHGFKKDGHSKWIRSKGDIIQLIYLQRSYVKHEYYIEAGICDRKDAVDIKKLNITDCRKARERINGMAWATDNGKEPTVDSAAFVVNQKFEEAFDFTEQGSQAYPEEYFFPSVGIEKARGKIAFIKHAAEQYIPAWFDKYSGVL